MPGSLLYKLLQTKSKYPLHAAVRLMREDVVFLYLVEHNAEVSFLLPFMIVEKLNWYSMNAVCIKINFIEVI